MSAYTDDDGLVTEVNLDGAVPANTEFFRMKEAEKRRISLVWLRADSTPRILSAPVKYIAGVGKVVSRLGKDGPEADKLWSEGEPPRVAYATLVLAYPVASGKIDHARLLTGIDVVRWTFSEKTFAAIQKIATAGSLGKTDLGAVCTSEQYQRIELTRLAKCCWWEDEAIREGILSRARELEATVSPARRLSTEELALRLGKTWPPLSEANEAPSEPEIDWLESGSV